MSPEGPSVQRLVVAFTAQGADPAALETLARLAASLHVEIEGLFVEDINLLRLAALPVARALSPSGTPMRLDVAEMERQLLAQAEAARRQIEALAARAGVRWHFAVARGQLAAEIMAAAGGVDMLALGLARRRFGARLPEPRRRLQTHPIAVVYSGSDAGKRALTLARLLARDLARPLFVLILAHDEKSAAALREEATAFLGGTPARFRHLVDPTVRALRDAAEAEAPAFLLIEQGSAVIDAEAVRMLNDELSCPSLIVR